MIIAGIDEAGLGPKLGPLTVSLTAFELDKELITDPAVSFWEILSSTTTSRHCRKDPRLLITDSKIAYNAQGITGLQQTVCQFFQEVFPEIQLSHISHLLEHIIHPQDYHYLKTTTWYQELFQPAASPLQQTAENNFALNGLKPCELRSRIITARELNNFFALGYNKSETLLKLTGSHIQYLVKTYQTEEVFIYVDKQGGKSYYAPYLSDLLAGTWITTVREGADSSVYKINNNITIEFLPKADQKKFPVALASIIAKFLREISMEAFNSYFKKFLPEIKPTAGYPKDAPRFLQEIQPVIKKAGISAADLWRER